MLICTALLKYGYHNFSLTILEFFDVDNLMSREKYDAYSPEYNILNTPGSPSRGSGWKHSWVTRENMRIAALNRDKSQVAIDKLSAAQPNGIKVEVIDLGTNTSTVYSSSCSCFRFWQKIYRTVYILEACFW